MKRAFSFVVAFSATFLAASVNAENIAPGATYAQTFDSLGNSGTATLPSGWSATSSASVRSVSSTEWEDAGTATEKQGTGTGTNAGIYNWGDADNESDRGVGFLASGSAAKTGNLYLSLTATGFIPSFTVSYDMKCYRNNTRQYRFQLYYSTDDGTTWTSAGSDFCTSNIVATSGVVLNPAGVTAVSSKTLNVSLASGETVILCWSYSVSSGTQTSNAQGLGIDNVSIVAEASSGPAPLAAPIGLSVSSVTDSGFSLSWTAVADADDYEVEVLAGSAAAGTVSVSGTRATVEGLSADTDYTAKVRALPPAASTTLLASDWSAPTPVRTKLADGLEFDPLFNEPFGGSANNSTSWASTTSILSSDGNFIANIATNNGWMGTGGMRKAPQSILFGTQNLKGTATTPSIRLRASGPSNATVRIHFQAAKKNGTSAASVNVIASSSSGTFSRTVTLPEIDTSSESDLSNVPFSFVDLAVSSPFTVTFEPAQTDSRCYLDNVIVEQIYDPNYAVLVVPTGVAGSDVGKYGFTVSWTGVEHATGYEVWLNGAFHGFCASAFTSMSLTGLSDGTIYSVQVKALGDNLHFGDSPLSAAISVTTLADAQKIDFTVTGAPASDVFAGDTVSFTVTAENEATHAAEPVSFSGIAGATFTAATGAFSWTPTEGDVGSHTATFASGDYSTNVTITVISALKTETLAAEYFSEIKSTSWTSTSGYASELEGDMGQWTGHDIIKTKSAVIIGKGGSPGTIVSPEVELKVLTPGSLSVSFDTGSLSNKTASVTASILDAADDRVVFEQTFATLASLPVYATAVSDAGAHFTLAPGSSVALPAAVKVKFETVETAGTDSQRAYVDTVVFAQTVSARIRDLAAPTGLAVVEGTVETNGFSVGWSTVSDATNYAVRVTDASGAVVFSAPFCAATSASVTGLADDEVYNVQVRATGDEATCFASPWSDALAVRTARSPLHPTLTLGAWQNAVGNGKVYGGLANTATVSAERDNGEAVIVTLDSVSPAPTAGPTLENGVLSWIPADADTNKTFTVSFRMDGIYATNLSVKILPMDPLHAPDVTVGPVAWDAFDLAWNSQYRAAGYGVRVWTDCPNPAATATLVEERFPSYYKKGGGGNRPAGWIFHVTGVGYANDTAPVQFSKDGNWMATYDLGGPISSVSFFVKGNGMTDGSTLRAYWAGALTDAEMEDKDNWTNNLLVAVSDLGGHSQTVTAQIPAGADARRIAWLYEQHDGNIGVGTVVIEGEGFSTPQWLAGWGPVAKNVGLVQTCTVAKPRPGTVLGVDPADKSKDLTVPRVNYAEVTVRDAAGATLSTVIEVDVPAPPRSARATLMILK